ncbi:DUF427 domain-containing protein [soil metagenome]
MDKTVKIPGPDHPITIEPGSKHIRVSFDGKTIADTRRALILTEASYPPVAYVPREDVDMAQLVRTDHTTYCPYKGDCSYYSVVAGGDKTANAVWTYESPYAAVAPIKDYLAFYTSRVEVTES